MVSILIVVEVAGKPVAGLLRLVGGIHKEDVAPYWGFVEITGK